MLRLGLNLLTAIAATAICSIPLAASSCENLADAKLPHAEIAVAKSIAAGRFVPPYGDPIEEAPAFCRVAGVLKPTADSVIRFEVWLPTAGWNGKFLGVGNGGFAGSIGFGSMGANLKRGYATASTDTGHEADSLDASWAYKHPEKITDFGYRGLHETTVVAKQIVEMFYGKPAARSYFDSCSNGGREALMEAQRFPDDYDGILAGAPANNWTHMVSAGIKTSKDLYGNPASYISAVKLNAIESAANRACDASDGLKDGIANDPERCTVKPSSLVCKGAESRDCLTTPQAAALTALYEGAKDARGQVVFPGYVPGAEAGAGGWSRWISGEAPGMGSGAGFVQNYFRYMVYDDPSWTPLAGNMEGALKRAIDKTAKAVDATNPDLQRFHNRGGKLILYHGWNDPAISAHNTVNYFSAVKTKMGDDAAAGFVRLYMVPGMQHCIGGPGPTSFGQLGTTTAKGSKHGIYDALEAWVEKDIAPAEIVATKYAPGEKVPRAVMTRPLCPYPQLATYKGDGDTNDTTNFSCQNPSAGSH